MRKRVLLALVALFCLPTLCGERAAAQTLGEIAIGGMGIGAGAAYATSAKNKVSDGIIMARLQGLGFKDIVKDPKNDQCYFVREQNGALYKITLEPTTGTIISAIPQSPSDRSLPHR